jgi:hypothetical protein
MKTQHSFLGSLAIASFLFAATPVLAGKHNDTAPHPTTLSYAKPSKCVMRVKSKTAKVSSVVITTKPAQYTASPGGSAPVHQYDWPAWNPHGSDLTPALTPEEQSGDCPLGTPDAPTYGGPIPGDDSQSPWGSNPPWRGNPPPSSGGGGFPGGVYPSGGYPGSGTHGNGTSGNGTPGNGTPGNGTPGNGTPGNGTPGNGTPGNGTPGNGTPGSGTHGNGTSGSGTPGNGTYGNGNGTYTNGTSDCVLIDPSKIPVTGKTRQYNFEISYRQIAPDGVSKQGIVINGGFPGPTIEANWGDWIEVTVKNSLGKGSDGTPEGSTIHWHGLLQHETPFMDGVPSVSQCPIVPGDTFTYRFRADQVGTSWFVSNLSTSTPYTNNLQVPQPLQCTV